MSVSDRHKPRVMISVHYILSLCGFCLAAGILLIFPAYAQKENTGHSLLSPLQPLIHQPAYKGADISLSEHQQVLIERSLKQAHMQQVMDLEDARHLVQRTGFGASPIEIAALIGLSREEAVRRLIASVSRRVTVSPPDFVFDIAPPFNVRADMTQKERHIFRHVRRSEIEALRHWWIAEMVSTSSPLTERLMLFWHNHFVSAYSGLDDWSHAIARQHFLFRAHLRGSLRGLLHAMIRDPALLGYLDNDRNTKDQPNENFARELMELFTLGIGQYTENDVKEAARALAGWGVAQDINLEFRIKPSAQDKGVKTILGKTGAFDADDLVEILLKQDATAHFIVEKFWRFFISSFHLDPKEMDKIATVFRESDYALDVVLTALFASPAFWAPENRATLIKSPVNLIIGTLRSLPITPPNSAKLAGYMKHLGQVLFNPPNVAGWPGGKAWITPGALLSRDDILEKLLASSKRLNSDPMENPQSESMQTSNQIFSQTSGVSDILANILYADRFFVSHIRSVDRGRADIRFMARHLRLNNRQWPVYQFKIAKRNSRLGILIEAGNCYPECLDYENNDIKGAVEKQEVFFPLVSSFTKADQAAWRRLSEDDQMLITGLVSALPEIRRTLHISRRAARNLKRKTDWLAILDQVLVSEKAVWPRKVSSAQFILQKNDMDVKGKKSNFIKQIISDQNGMNVAVAQGMTPLLKALKSQDFIENSHDTLKESNQNLFTTYQILIDTLLPMKNIATILMSTPVLSHVNSVNKKNLNKKDFRHLILNPAWQVM